MSSALEYAAEVSLLLAVLPVPDQVAIVVGDDQATLAEQMLSDGRIAAYVAFADTPNGVSIGRFTYDERLANVIDNALACVAGNAIELTAAEAQALAGKRGAA